MRPSRAARDDLLRKEVEKEVGKAFSLRSRYWSKYGKGAMIPADSCATETIRYHTLTKAAV